MVRYRSSVFFFTFSTNKKLGGSMAIATQKIRRSIHVLLVEDNLGDVVLIREVFKASSLPIQVIRVKDGVEALDFLANRGQFIKAERPDLILLDLNMPKISGLEVLEAIKSDPQLRAIPVVVLTNSKLESDIRQAYEHRANFYLVKPSDLDELYPALKYVEDIWLRNVLADAD
jgi:chemotaxis family two-component system response regulator Rcp1